MGRSHQPQGNILLDWFVISYRAIALIGATVLVFGGGAFYYLHAQGYWETDPRTHAQREITSAANLLVSATKEVGDQEGLHSLAKNAEILLDEARQQLQEGSFLDSRSSAIQSQYLSQKILDHARGQPTHMVRLYKVEGVVRVKRSGSFLWERATTRIYLNVGDQVKTASNGSAQIVYFDGTITTVKPGSLVEIKELYEDPATKVRRVREEVRDGTVSATTQRRNVKGSYHEVATENVVARAEDRAHFDVEFDQSIKTTRMRVQSGNPRLRAGGQTLSLKPLEFVEVDLKAGVTDRGFVPTVPVLLEPVDQRAFLYVKPEEAVTILRWKEIPGIQKYRLQISHHPLFSNLLLDRKDVRFSNVKLPRLPEGSYYWRVSASGEEGREGAFSTARKFLIRSRQLRNVEDRDPPPLEIRDFLPSGPLVIINGTTEAGATLFVNRQKVDVYEDGSFTAVVRLQKEGINRLEIQVQDAAGNTTSVNKSVYVESF